MIGMLLPIGGQRIPIIGQQGITPGKPGDGGGYHSYRTITQPYNDSAGGPRLHAMDIALNIGRLPLRQRPVGMYGSLGIRPWYLTGSRKCNFAHLHLRIAPVILDRPECRIVVLPTARLKIVMRSPAGALHVTFEIDNSIGGSISERSGN